MDNLQKLIDEASNIADGISMSGCASAQMVDAMEAIRALCAALQIIKQEFRYYQKL